MSWLQRICRLFAGEKPETFEGRSPKWEKVRGLFLVHHPECEACGGKTDLNVHHIVPVSFDPSLELVTSNLIVLCENGVGGANCHLLFGHGGDFRAMNPKCIEDAARNKKRIKERVYK